MKDPEMMAFWSFSGFGGWRLGSAGLVFRSGVVLSDHAQIPLVTPFAELMGTAAILWGGSFGSSSRGLVQCVREGCPGVCQMFAGGRRGTPFAMSCFRCFQDAVG